jgi:hypothetical protein
LDSIARAIFATGLTMMFGVLYVSLVFGGHKDTVAQLLESGAHRVAALFAAGALAISGPMAVVIVQGIAWWMGHPSKDRSKGAWLEEL